MLPEVPMGPIPDPAFTLVALTAVKAELPRRGGDRLTAGPASDHSSRRTSSNPVTEPV